MTINAPVLGGGGSGGFLSKWLHFNQHRRGLGGSRWCAWGQIPCSPTISIIKWLAQLLLSRVSAHPWGQLWSVPGFLGIFTFSHRAETWKSRAKWKAATGFPLYCHYSLCNVNGTELHRGPSWGGGPWGRMAISLGGIPVLPRGVKQVLPAKTGRVSARITCKLLRCTDRHQRWGNPAHMVWGKRKDTVWLCDSGQICQPLWASISSFSMIGNPPFFLTQWVIKI